MVRIEETGEAGHRADAVALELMLQNVHLMFECLAQPDAEIVPVDFLLHPDRNGP